MNIRLSIEPTWLFDYKFAAVELHVVGLKNGGFGVLQIFKLDKSVATLHDDIIDGAIGVEQFSQVTALNVVSDAADVDLNGIGPRCGWGP